MPNTPEAWRRSPAWRASQVTDRETRAEGTDLLTRRKVLGMVPGGIAATSIVGTAAGKSHRPTVYASPLDCGIGVAYTGRGPEAVDVSIDGEGEGPKEETIHRGDSKQVSPLMAGEYYITARPANSNGSYSIPVDGSPVTVTNCKSITVSLWCVGDDSGWLVIDGLDTCVALRYEMYRNGEEKDNGTKRIEGSTNMFPLDFTRHDEWIFWAHLPADPDDCKDTSGPTILINDEPSPLHFEGDGCTSVTTLSGSLPKR